MNGATGWCWRIGHWVLIGCAVYLAWALIACVLYMAVRRLWSWTTHEEWERRPGEDEREEPWG